MCSIQNTCFTHIQITVLIPILETMIFSHPVYSLLSFYFCPHALYISGVWCGILFTLSRIYYTVFPLDITDVARPQIKDDAKAHRFYMCEAHIDILQLNFVDIVVEMTNKLNVNFVCVILFCCAMALIHKLNMSCVRLYLCNGTKSICTN